MTAPAGPVETQGQLIKTGQVTLDTAGNGVLIFDPDNSSQRWEITSVAVSTNQSATATVIPIATIALNTVSLNTMSPGNYRGASWSGNNDTFTGKQDVGPVDFFTVLYSPPVGQTGAGVALAGVIGTAIITGTKFTRRS